MFYKGTKYKTSWWISAFNEVNDWALIYLIVNLLFFLDFLESGDIVAGDDKGSVRCYSVSVEGEYYMSSEFVAHTSPVNAILVLGDGTIGKKYTLP